jgi:hypothetical protein
MEPRSGHPVPWPLLSYSPSGPGITDGPLHRASVIANLALPLGSWRMAESTCPCSETFKADFGPSHGGSLVLSLAPQWGAPEGGLHGVGSWLIWLFHFGVTLGWLYLGLISVKMRKIDLSCPRAFALAA